MAEAEQDERLEISERATVIPDVDVPEEIEERLREEGDEDAVDVDGL